MANKKIIRPSFTQPDNSPLGPKEKLNEAKLYMMLKGMPVQQMDGFLAMSWQEAFALAADAEGFRKQMGAGDIAVSRFMSEEHNFLLLAERLEMRESYIHKLEN